MWNPASNQASRLESKSYDNEFTWIIQGDTFNSLADNYGGYNNQNRTGWQSDKFQSPSFTQCGGKWILEITRTPWGCSSCGFEENIKLICKKLNQSIRNIYVNYYIECVEATQNAIYCFGDTFTQNALSGNIHNPLKIGLHRVCYNLKSKNINKLTIKCTIHETMKLEEMKNDEFSWNIYGKLWDYFKRTNGCISPIFKASNGTEWNMDVQSSYKQQMNMTLKLRNIEDVQKDETFGVQCIFTIQETGQLTEAIGVFNASQRYEFGKCGITESNKYEPFTMQQISNLKQVTIKAKLKFLHNAATSNWNIIGYQLQQFKYCQYNHSMISPYLMCGDAIWYIKVFPNGRSVPKLDDFHCLYGGIHIATDFFKHGNGVIYLYQVATNRHNGNSLYHITCPQLNYYCTVYPEQVNFNSIQSKQRFLQRFLCEKPKSEFDRENPGHVVLPKAFKYQQLQNLDKIVLKLNAYKEPFMGITKKWAVTQNEIDSKQSQFEMQLNDFKWMVKLNRNKIIFQLQQYPSSISSVTITRTVTTCYPHILYQNQRRCGCRGRTDLHSKPVAYPDDDTSHIVIEYVPNGNMKDMIEIAKPKNNVSPSDIMEMQCTMQIIRIQHGKKLNMDGKEEEKEQQYNDENKNEWKCHRCTYMNNIEALQCVICLSMRIKEMQIDKGGGDEMTKLKQAMDLNEKLKKEIQRLRDMNDTLRINASVERQQYEQKINSLQLEIKRLNNKTIDTDNWRHWNQNDIIKWIVSIDNNRFVKYKKILQDAFSEQQVTAEDLTNINENDIFNWGIKIIKDKKLLCHYIAQLTHNQHQNNQLNEGIMNQSTAYI